MSRPTVHPTPWQDLGADVAAALELRLTTMVDELTRGVTVSVPGFAGIDQPRFHRDARETVRVALRRFVTLAGTGEPALTPEVREVYVALGAAEAREDRGPEALISALRAAARLLLREASDAVLAAGPLSVDQVLRIADATNAFVDELVAACTDGYAQQVRELAGERDRRRHRLAELLLEGGASPHVVQQAAAAVGWDPLERVTPVLLPRVEAREARFRYGSEGLVSERGDEVVVIIRHGTRFDRDLLGPRLRGRGAVIGPTAPWTDLPEAVRLTELTARLTGGREVEVMVDDHLVELALQGHPSAVALLVRSRLAAFDGLPEAQRRPLLVTLESWLRHWGARAPVAEELFVHPQTVSYRMRRVRQLLGVRLDDPAYRFEALLALADVLGRDVAHTAAADPGPGVDPQGETRSQHPGGAS
ncbi:PucR family transcriptional regulator [Nocardioides sp.]|uniref:PucR family transcriptional regulator n=1 Tax=Nocardioides sp. TaxID=35761 RepID=UPI00261349C0|nr:PucR family transcriptional regulator [Nocardioides sp.]MDI6909555.1 helix-turn-helix domain-containing protein [Nocardioides sp.]